MIINHKNKKTNAAICSLARKNGRKRKLIQIV